MAINGARLVSIITPTYNSSEYLEELIQSVQNQDYPKIEHIIIDDGSQDNGVTLTILRKYPHLHWWSRANRGQYATMNEGLSAANGEVVCFVSADDLVSPGAVSSVIEYLSTHSGCDGVFGITSRIDSQGKPVPYYIPFQTAPISFYPYFAHISHCSLYIRKESLTKHGLVFDPSLKYVGDYEWMIRLYMARLKIGLLRCELSRVRLHAEQTSQKYSSGSRVEAQEVIKQHQINRLSFIMLNALYRLLFKIWYMTQAIKHGEMTMLIKRQVNKYGHK